MNGEAGPPVVALPAVLGRKLRLGPFPSARHALRFVAYAAAGVFVATWVTPLGWVPFVAGGFVLSVYQTHGQSLDEFAAGFVRFRWRAARSRASAGTGGAVVRAGQTLVRLPGGRTAAGVRTGGVPVAFLPPEEARALFQAYQEWLRGLEEGALLRVASEPLSAAPFQVAPPSESTDADAPARTGYSEMIRLLCRRRRRRFVDIVLWTLDNSAASRARLEGRVESMVDRLGGLGIPAQRTTGPAFIRSLGGMGWAPEVIE